MTRTPIRWLMLLSLIVLPAATTRAEEPEAKGEMDEISKSALETYMKVSYSAGVAGVKKASAACAGSMEGMMGKVEAKGSYAWDGKKGKLNWNNPMLAQTFQQQGFDASTIDGIFESDSWGDHVKGLKLVGTKTPTGVDIAVTGKSEMGLKSMQFNGDGVLTKIAATQDAPGMGTINFEVTFTYEKKGDKHRPTGWVTHVDLGPQGKVVDTATITWTTVGAYDVFAKVVSSATMGGQSVGTKTMALSDWKFNDDVTIEAAADGCGKTRKADDDGCDDGCGDDDEDGCGDDDEDEGCDDDDGCDD